MDLAARCECVLELFLDLAEKLLHGHVPACRNSIPASDMKRTVHVIKEAAER